MRPTPTASWPARHQPALAAQVVHAFGALLRKAHDVVPGLLDAAGIGNLGCHDTQAFLVCGSFAWAMASCFLLASSLGRSL